MPSRHFGKGELIIEQGARGDRSFVIRSGKVLVCRKEGPGQLVPIQELGPGEIFGEMYLISKDATRNATVIAMNDVTVDVLFEETVKHDVQLLSPLQKILFRGLNNRLNQTTDKFVHEKVQNQELSRKADSAAGVPPPDAEPNSEEQRKALMALVHDLKTPISAEYQILQLLMKGNFGAVSPEQAEVLEAMLESNRYMASLVENMLKVYQYQAGRVTLRRELINLNTLIRAEVENLITYVAKSKEVDIRLELDDTLPQAWIDPLEVHRVINNLIQNALTHTPSHGCITVTSELRDHEAVITVEDTGVGIQPEVLKFLFDEDRPPDTLVSGAGLGLVLSKHIVDKHGGLITVESQPGKGSRFCVTFPLRKGAHGETLAESSAS